MERTYNNYERCSEAEAGMVALQKCPDCYGPLAQGPSGGLSINFWCLTPMCGSGFNDMFVFGVQRISDARPNCSQR